MDTMLFVKRALVWTLSFVIGIAITLFLIYVPLETDFDTYSLKYFLLTAISIASIFVIWADLLVGTKILPD